MTRDEGAFEQSSPDTEGRSPGGGSDPGDRDGAGSPTAARLGSGAARIPRRWALPAAAAVSVGVLFTGTAAAFGGLGLPGSGPPPLGPSGADRQDSATGPSASHRAADSGRASASAEPPAAEPPAPAKSVAASDPSTAGPDTPVSSDGRRSVTLTPPDRPDGKALPGAPPARATADPGHRAGGGTSGSPGNHPMTGHWAELKAGGKALVVHFFGSPATPKECSSEYHASATETPDQVRVRIRAREPAGTSASAACPGIAAERTVTLKLDRPLGDRTVVRMPEEREIPVRDR